MNTSLVSACSFFGHRKIEIDKEIIKTSILPIIENLIINNNCRTFLFRGFGEFDSVCYEVVSSLQAKYSNIKRVFCLFDSRHENPRKRPQWLKNQEYEDFIYWNLKYDHWYTRIYYRNIEIISHSDYVLFYVVNTYNSGAFKAMQYAKKIKKPYLNIANKKESTLF